MQSSNKDIRYKVLQTPLGEMTAGATGIGVCQLLFSEEIKNKKNPDITRTIQGSNTHLELLARQLAEYFNGNRREFSVPLDITGSIFQVKVWQSLQQISYGSSSTYGEQSRLLGNPAAIRAVAHANGMNPVAILIPCHRVIGNKGQLTGYAGGLHRKRWLLDLESPAMKLF